MKVLIADDDKMTRLMLGKHIAGWGYDVVVAEDGAQAIEILDAEDAPPLILLDWIMPKVSGIDVCKHLMEDINSHHYVIMLTGKTKEDDLVQAFAAGANDFVTKPVTAPVLRSRLQAGQKIIEQALQLNELVVECNKTIAELTEALSTIKTLNGLLPICANCKNVRDDEGYWNRIETYVASHSNANFTHGLCPGCAKDLYPDLELDLE